MTVPGATRAGRVRPSLSRTAGPGRRWTDWRASPPDPHGIPVEVFHDGWQHTRLWRPAGPPPEDAPALVWRHGSAVLRHLATLGGLYGPEGGALFGSPELVISPSDPNGPWHETFVIGPVDRHSSPATRLWLVPPCLNLVQVPSVVLGDLVTVADRGETVVMRGRDGGELRKFACEIVGMTGGWRA